MKVDYNEYETKRYYIAKWLKRQLNDTERLILDGISIAANWTVPRDYRQAWF